MLGLVRASRLLHVFALLNRCWAFYSPHPRSSDAGRDHRAGCWSSGVGKPDSITAGVPKGVRSPSPHGDGHGSPQEKHPWRGGEGNPPLCSAHRFGTGTVKAGCLGKRQCVLTLCCWNPPVYVGIDGRGAMPSPRGKKTPPQTIRNRRVSLMGICLPHQNAAEQYLLIFPTI